MARIAVLLSSDFEDSEYRVPVDRLRQAGHQVTLVGKRAGETVSGKKGKESATLDASARDTQVTEFDGLLIPGGYSPDHLRTDHAVVGLVRAFAESGKPIAAVCHGPQLLIEADVVRGKTVTSWPSVKTDLRNAGARWVDQQVVQDGALITARKPEDLEAFSAALLGVL
jgi:protease I